MSRIFGTVRQKSPYLLKSKEKQRELSQLARLVTGELDKKAFLLAGPVPSWQLDPYMRTARPQKSHTNNPATQLNNRQQKEILRYHNRSPHGSKKNPHTAPTSASQDNDCSSASELCAFENDLHLTSQIQGGSFPLLRPFKALGTNLD